MSARKLHYPMGLDIGGDSPAAIALSALAEVQAVLADRRGGFLRQRESTIHITYPLSRQLVT